MFTQKCNRSIFEYLYARLEETMSSGIVGIVNVICCLNGIECLCFFAAYNIGQLFVISYNNDVHATRKG